MPDPVRTEIETPGGGLPVIPAADLSSIFSPRATTLPVLRYLVALADHGHFGRAAAACGVSQPTLSAQIAQWEKRLGVQAFVRTGSGVRVTPAGACAVAGARAVLDDLRRMESAATGGPAPFFGPVRLGVIPTIGPYALPYLCPAVEQAWPDLEMPIHEAQSQVLIDLLEQARLDLILLAELPALVHPLRTIAPLCDEQFFLAMPPNHHLAEKAAVSRADVSGERLLLLDQGHCLRDQALELCQLRDHLPRAGADYRATSLETLRHLVALGHGCTVLPALAAPPESTDIVLRPLVPPAFRTLVLAWRIDDTRGAGFRLMSGVMKKALPRGRVKVR